MKNPNEMNKDQRYREKDKNLKELVTQLVNMILGDDSYGKRNLDKRIESVTKAIAQLKNKEFAVKLLNSFCANEVGESPPNIVSLNENGVAPLEMAKEESQSFGEELKQIMAILEQKEQSMKEAMVYTTVAKLLQTVMNSCSNIAAYHILNPDCVHQVEGLHGVEIEGEELILKFPQTHDSIQINQKGENVEVHNQEMIDQENQGNQVVLTLRSEGGRLAELNLAKLGSLPVDLTDDCFPLDFSAEDFGFFCDSCCTKDGAVKAVNWDEGTSNAPTNEVNVKLQPDDTCVFQSYKDNASVLLEILQEHPNIIDSLQLSSQHLQDYFMNLLAQIYQKIIKGKSEMLKLEDITSMEAMVRDMEHNGLQVTWLKEKLAKSRERSENQEAKNKLLERINSCKAETEETEQELAQVAKKQRLK